MNLFDLITNFKTKNNNEQLKLDPIQLDENGARDDLASLQMKNAQEPLSLGERLVGRTLEQDKQTINPEGESKLETIRSERPGLLNDISNGYQENRFTPVKLDNFTQNTTNGRPKGFAYRLGEGLGSISRLADSPLGRGLIVGGIVGATGGSGLEALAYGSKAGVLNQQNRMQDTAYRNQLRNFGQMSDDEIDNIRGYINDDTYKNLLQAQQYKDSADWKKMYFQANQDNLQVQREWQQKQAEIQKAEKQADREYQRQKDDADRAVKVRGQNLDYELGKNKLKQDNSNKQSDKVDDAKVVMLQLDKLMGLHQKLPQYNARKGLQKGTAFLSGVLSDRGLRNNEISAFEGVRNMMTNLVARKLAGEKGVMTDRDFSRAEKMVPNVYDSPQQAKAKYEALKLLYYANPNNIDNPENDDNDPLGLGI